MAGSTELVAAGVGAGSGALPLPQLDVESGSSFGYFDRMFTAFEDGKVFDYSDWKARDMHEMLRADYKSRQLESALSLPFIAAERSIAPVKGDKGEAEWLQAFWDADPISGGCKTTLDEIVDLMTSAISYSKAFFEKVWTAGTGDFAGKVVYKDVAWRPQTTCQLARSADNGDFAGFRQEPYYIGTSITKGVFPIDIPAKRSFVYIHNKRRDPLNGSSDMEVAYWCWQTKQKILFLWFQFLENVSLPRQVVMANDIGTAREMAQELAKLKSSGVIPVAAPQGPSSVSVTSLDVSGKGAEQFQAAATWLDQAAVNAVLAGFLNLTNAEKNGGSYALSRDSSDFFLQMEEAKGREMEAAVRKYLFAPLVRYNFGPKAAVPTFKFEPLNDIDKQTGVTLLQAMLTAKGPDFVPDEFVAELIDQVADYIGLDGKKVRAAFKKTAREAQKKAEEQAQAQGMPPAGQAVAGVQAAADVSQDTINQAAALFMKDAA